ncbi:MAG: phosphoribosylamine--glycine ligase [Candidatus Woesearchaeota archaeon]
MSDKEDVLVIGKGGREHALAWKLSISPHIGTVYVAPGNPGTNEEQGIVNIDLDGAKPENFPELYNFVKSNNVGTVVCGPEDPLAAGLVDFFHDKGYKRVFGPTKSAAELEASKIYSWKLMTRVGLLQADSIEYNDLESAVDAVDEVGGRGKEGGQDVVIKADKLCAGKGVLVCDEPPDRKTLEKHLEDYGNEGLVAQRLRGEEFSVFGFSDGEKVRALQASFQDHKPRDDCDRGPNTGGMGAYGPAPVADSDIVKIVQDQYMTPLIQKMREEGRPFVGFLYGGMMMTSDGIYVIEWNIRHGDPECQPAVALMNSDLYEVIDLCLNGKADQADLSVKPGYSCCIVVAGPDYPSSSSKGKLIMGVDAANNIAGCKVFHAGTALNDRGELITAGGRLLGVTSYHADMKEAQKIAYAGANLIDVQGGKHMRNDIMDKAFGR